MTIPWQRRGARHPEPAPDEIFSIQNPQIVEVTGPQLRALPETGAHLFLVIVAKSALYNEVSAYLYRGVAIAGDGLGA